MRVLKTNLFRSKKGPFLRVCRLPTRRRTSTKFKGVLHRAKRSFPINGKTRGRGPWDLQKDVFLGPNLLTSRGSRYTVTQTCFTKHDSVYLGVNTMFWVSQNPRWSSRNPVGVKTDGFVVADQRPATLLRLGPAGPGATGTLCPARTCRSPWPSRP